MGKDNHLSDIDWALAALLAAGRKLGRLLHPFRKKILAVHNPRVYRLGCLVLMVVYWKSRKTEDRKPE
jgi:hypothetical protein